MRRESSSSEKMSLELIFLHVSKGFSRIKQERIALHFDSLFSIPANYHRI